MASNQKIGEVIMAIKTVYPYYSRDNDSKILAKTWSVLLKDFPDEVVEMALYKCLQICKMPPTPADIIEQINLMHKSVEPSDEELWAVYCTALNETARQISRFAYTYVDETGISQGQQARNKVDEIWAGLPEKVKGYLASKGELMRNAREHNMSSDYATWEKQRFMKAMPIMAKRQEYNGLMLDGGAERLMLK